MILRGSRNAIDYLVTISLICMVTSGCKKDKTLSNPLLAIPYDPTPALIETPTDYPAMEVPSDNQLTVEGIELGRHLFYDPLLSADYTMSCSSCHLPKGNFSDNLAVSVGIDGIAGGRSSMPLLDVAFANDGLFWDGRSANLEDQALLPVEDSIELHNTWSEVLQRLVLHKDYPKRFRRAFGIEHPDEITKALAAKALAQFERSLVSTGTSKYDRFVRGEVDLTDEEYLGYILFFDLDPEVTDAECAHCHNAPLFTINEYRNNGIDSVPDLQSFSDRGRGAQTGNALDNGKFKIPTLRNIALSAPYMHDGRFTTLEEVIEHYNSGGHFRENLDPLLHPLRLQDDEKEAIILFLHTLTDTAFVQNPIIQNPFD